MSTEQLEELPAVAAEIKELKEKIQRLGNVNLDAIGEMDELEQRQQFLSAQMKLWGPVVREHNIKGDA